MEDANWVVGPKIAPTAVWPTNKAWAIVWVPTGSKDAPTGSFCHLLL